MTAADFSAQLAALTRRDETARIAGGRFQLWVPFMPGSRRLMLRHSFATRAEAEAALAGCYPTVRRLAEIREASRV